MIHKTKPWDFNQILELYTSEVHYNNIPGMRVKFQCIKNIDISNLNSYHVLKRLLYIFNKEI